MIWKLIEETYKGKKVFVTGHTGFKGGWLTKILSMAGAVVKGYSLPPNTTPDLYSALDVSNLCDSVFGDILDAPRMNEEIQQFQPDFVFHLAAQPLVRTSYSNPAETFAINSIGTAYLLDAVRNLAKPCTSVLITTDKVYHNNEWDYPYRECDRLGGYDPYSASKACAELVIDSYRNCYFNRAHFDTHQKQVLVARAGNVIGGGDWSVDRLVPDIIRALEADTEVVLRNPASVRPWQHVLEPLGGYLLLGALADTHKLSDAYNFGPNTEDTLTVEQIVKMAIRILGEGGYKIQQNPGDLHEAKLLKLDISLARTELKWTPKLSATQALEWTLEWYKTYRGERDQIIAQTELQIKQYFDFK